MKLMTVSIVTIVLLASFFSMFGNVSAEENQEIKMISGTIREDKYYNETKDWNQDGDFVAIKLGSSVFAVTYGTENSTNPVSIVSFNIRYLGGATVTREDGGLMIPKAPIPVATMAFQQFWGLLEFKDSGLPNHNNTGSGNGVFDFVRTGRGLDDFDFAVVEPVYKVVNLSTAWKISDIVESSPHGNNTKEWTFSLSAYNLSYEQIGPKQNFNDTDVLDEITFTFHIGASVNDYEVDVPWFNIAIDKNENIISSERDGTRHYTGESVNADFKFDQYIEGWDYWNKDNDSRLMLETVTAFGTFIPNIVDNWISTEFINKTYDKHDVYYRYKKSPDEIKIYNKTIDNENEVDKNNSIDVEVITKDGISFKDNWERISDFTWVSDVESDGVNDTMLYQIHGRQRLENLTYGKGETDSQGKNEKGRVFGIVLLGGYIYPAGEVLFHDPSFQGIALNIDFIIDTLNNGILLFQLAIGCIAMMGVVIWKKKK